MKEILHKTRNTLDQRAKIISILENSEDQNCVTNIRKNFVYVVSPEEQEAGEAPQPDIEIKKSFDTKTRDEKFAFRIKGTFFVNRHRRIVKVDYCHSLKIHLHWKTKVFSPKKSVTMA